MTFARMMLALACVVASGIGTACATCSAQAEPVALGAHMAPEANVTQLMSKDLLEGTIVMQGPASPRRMVRA